MSEKVLQQFNERAAAALIALRALVNEKCEHDDKFSLVLKTAGSTLLACYIYDIVYNNDKHFTDRLQSNFFKTLRLLPIIGPKIKNEVEKAKASVRKNKDLYNPSYVLELPAKSKTVDEMKLIIKDYLDMDTIDWRNGRVQGAVYDHDAELIEISAKAYEMFIWSNPLHADVFKGVRKMEAEVLAMCLKLYNGPTDSCGLFTCGGTESIGLAVLSARNMALAKGIKWPELIMPATAHPAFDKACDYFRVKKIKVAVHPTTYEADVSKMKSAISSSTCLLVGSAPTYPHGVYDDFEKINELARKYNIPFHIDCCLGGFINPFAAAAGYKIPTFDFRLSHVTSVSCDTHKYGYTPKGSSVVMFRTPELRRAAIYSCTDWPGGVYATPTYAGSRSGASSATTWACMLKIGHAGYIERTKSVLDAARALREGISRIEGLKIMGNSIGTVVAFTSESVNIFQLMHDLASKKKWIFGPLQFPSGIHITVTKTHTKAGVVNTILKDIEELNKGLIAAGSEYVSDAVAVYGLAQTIPDRSIVGSIAATFIETCLDTNIQQVAEEAEDTKRG